ncbi:MAG: hypothetical protein ACYC3X_08390 [Pirellulaceae bacterium]
MFHRNDAFVRVLCLAGLLGCHSGCTTQAGPPSRRGEPVIEAWDDADGEPVLVEDGP